MQKPPLHHCPRQRVMLSIFQSRPQIQQLRHSTDMYLFTDCIVHYVLLQSILNKKKTKIMSVNVSQCSHFFLAFWSICNTGSVLICSVASLQLDPVHKMGKSLIHNEFYTFFYYNWVVLLVWIIGNWELCFTLRINSQSVRKKNKGKTICELLNYTFTCKLCFYCFCLICQNGEVP